MPTELDLVFVPTADPTHDGDCLRALLARGEATILRVHLADIGNGSHEELATVVEEAGAECVVVGARTTVQAVNRAMLLSDRDVLVFAAPGRPVGPFVSELVAVTEAEDRAGLVVPCRVSAAPTDAELSRFYDEARLPTSTPLPVPDVDVAFVRRNVLRMIGALDLDFDDLHSALADLALRAQRLGMFTSRASRALLRSEVETTRHSLAIEELLRRHSHFASQRRDAETDFAVRASARAAEGARADLSVCLDLRYLPEGAINGTGVYAIELCRALIAHTPIRLTLAVKSEGQRESLRPLGVPIVLGEQIPEHVQVLHRPAQVFDPRDLDLLLRTPVPYVITYQDLIAYRAGSTSGGDGSYQRTYQRTSYVAVRAAQAVIAISEHNRREIVREFHVSPEHVRTVYHGVNADAYARVPHEDGSAQLEPLGMPQRFFVSIGADYAHKNTRLLLAAHAELRSRYSDPSQAPALVLVGHPSGTRDGVYPILREHPLPGVHYLGSVPHEVLRALYHRALAFVYLSAYEGFGLPLLEAMAAETPVLCSRYTSIPEVAGDAASYVVDMSGAHIADRLHALAEDGALRQRLTEAGKTRAAAFEWKSTALGSYASYRDAVIRPAPASLTDRRFLTELLASSSTP